MTDSNFLDFILQDVVKIVEDLCHSEIEYKEGKIFSKPFLLILFSCLISLT